MKKLLTLIALLAVFMGAKAEWKQDYKIDYSTYNGFPFYVMGFVPEWVDGVMTDYGAMYTYKTDSEMENYEFPEGAEEVGIVYTQSGTLYHKIKMASEGWHQYFMADGINTSDMADVYTVKAWVKASSECYINVNMGWGWGDGQQVGATVYIPQSDDFVEVEWDYSGIGGTSCNLVAQPGTFTGTIEWQSLAVGHYVKGESTTEWVENLTNGDAEMSWEELGLADVRYDDEDNNYKVCAWGRERGVNMDEYDNWVPFPATIENVDGSNVFVVHAQPAITEGDASAWDNQFWIQSPKAWKSGDQLKIHFRYKASVDAKTNTQIHKQAPMSYLIWHAIGDINFTTEWQEFDGTMTIGDDMNGGWSIAFNLNPENKDAIDFYFDDLSWQSMALEEGYFVTGCSIANGIEYDFDNATAFEYDEEAEVLVATVGAPYAYVDQIMISTVRGNDVAFKSNTLKPSGTIENDPDSWLDYTTAANAKINLPSSGFWKIYLDTEYSAMAFEMIEGQFFVMNDVITNENEVVVHAVERDDIKDDEHPDGTGAPWDNQFFLVANRTLDAGETTVLRFEYKADKEAKSSTQCHSMPGGYIYWGAIGDVNFTTEWQTFEKTFTIPSECAGKDMRTIEFNLAEIKDANNYHFRNFQWYLASDQEGKTRENLISPQGVQNFWVKEGAGTREHEYFEYDSNEDIVWTIAGSSEIFGSYWDPTDTNNDMSKVEDGVFVLTKNNVNLWAYNTLEFKVVGNHSWELNYGANGEQNGMNVTFMVYRDGLYDLQFVFNRRGGNMLSYSCEWSESNIDPNPSVVVVHGQQRDDLADEITEDGYVNVRENEGGTGQTWDNQFFIVANRPLRAGESTYIEFDYMSTFEARTNTMCNTDVYNYKYWDALGEIWFYPWQEHYVKEFIVPEEADGMNAICFQMAEIRDACDYTIKNVVWRLSDNTESLINQEGIENFWVKEGAGSQPHPYDPDAPQSSLMQETISFNTYSGTYFDGTQTINGEYGKVLFAQGEGSSQPYAKGSYVYFYPGNTMTLTSDYDIIKVQFSSYNWIGDYIFSTGEYSKNDECWRGNTPELTITNPLDYSYNRFYSVTVLYQETTPELLLARLTSQLEATAAAIEGLTYAVPGKAELEALATEAATATVETEKAQLKAYIKQLQEQTAAVVALDDQYKTLALLTADVATAAENNPFADATLLAEATAFVQEIEAGLLACTYTAEQVTALTAKLNNYIQQLSLIYLTIHVADPGSLGDLVLEKGVEFNDVAGLRVSGKLNTADQNTLKGFNNLQLIDLAETNLTQIINQQFSDKSTLKKVVLPNNTTIINSYAFQNCYALEEVVVPATLQTIGEYAFYNCKALSAFYFPEGLTRIGYDAFYCNMDSYYDAYGNYVQTGGSLKEISLPGTLVDNMGNAIGNYAFNGQTQLTKITLAEGITSIPESVFRNCISLTDLTLPSTLTNIGSYAFGYCSALKTLELPEGLISIQNNAFRNCSALEEVILPSTLQSLYRPFYSCPNLTKMTVKAIAAPDPQDYPIMGNTEAAANVTLTVPNLSLNAYKQAQYWNDFNIVGADIMPENITVNTDYRLNWPEGLALEYRPNIYVASSASLLVTGNSVLSAGNFTMAYSYRNATYNSWWNSEMQRYEFNRDNCFAALLNHATSARADQVSIEAYTPANQWSFMSMPFDVKASDIALMFAETPYVIRKYDGAKRAEGNNGQTWVNIGADETIPAGQGFILQSASTDTNRDYNGFTFTAINNEKKNNIFANDDVDVALTEYAAEFEHNRSWNLIGNPYPAYYDIRGMQTTAPITVWDNYNGNYQAYSPVDDAYILNPGQAFFIQRPINDGETLTFHKEGRQIDMEVRPVEDITNRAPMAEERCVFNLMVNGNEMGDRTRFVINNSAMMEYEAGRDANKFVSDEQSVQLYTIQNGVHFAINERPLGDAVIELGMMISKAGIYTFTLGTQVDNEVYLIDRLTGSEIRLDGTEGYSFDVEQGTIEGRFAIRLGGGDVTGIKTLDRDNNGENYYDLQGRKIEVPAKGVYINNGNKVVVK